MPEAHSVWTRHTPWRQGQVLPAEAVMALDLAADQPPDQLCAIVISHDCDLANDNLQAEPMVELIVGRMVPSLNGNFTWGKAPRTLHVPMLNLGQEVAIELQQTAKTPVSKTALAAFKPDPAWALESRHVHTLRTWLASRYHRAAFPDTFVNRMSQCKASEKLAKALEPHGELISFVYFDLDEGQHTERPDGAPYHLSVVLVFVAGDNPERAMTHAEQVADKVEGVLRQRFTPESGVVLHTCFAISEDDLPVSKARVLTQWRLEHMTQRADTAQPGPPAL